MSQENTINRKGKFNKRKIIKLNKTEEEKNYETSKDFAEDILKKAKDKEIKGFIFAGVDSNGEIITCSTGTLEILEELTVANILLGEINFDIQMGKFFMPIEEQGDDK